MLTLGQKDWPWAQGRLTAGFVLDLRAEPSVRKSLLFLSRIAVHGKGSAEDSTTLRALDLPGVTICNTGPGPAVQAGRVPARFLLDTGMSEAIQSWNPPSRIISEPFDLFRKKSRCSMGRHAS